MGQWDSFHMQVRLGLQYEVTLEQSKTFYCRDFFSWQQPFFPAGFFFFFGVARFFPWRAVLPYKNAVKSSRTYV